MSSLQWSLLIGAIALIAAVLLLNSLQQWKRRSRGEKTLEALREVVRSRKTTHETNGGGAIEPDAVNHSHEHQATLPSRQEPVFSSANTAEATATGSLSAKRLVSDSPARSSFSPGMRTASSPGIARSSPANSGSVSRADTRPLSRADARSVASAATGHASLTRHSLPDEFFDPVVDGPANDLAKEDAPASPDVKASATLSADRLSAIAMRAAQTVADADDDERHAAARQQTSGAGDKHATEQIVDAPAAFDSHDFDPPDDAGSAGVGEISEPVLDLKQWTRSKPWVGIDERVDLVVGLESWQGWQGERLLQAFQGLRRIGTKPLLLEAQVLSDPQQQAWVAVVPGLRFVRVRLGLLLANRSGPLKPTEYSDFLSALQSVRDLLQASWTDGTAPAGMHEVLERARRVDASCAALDAQVVINLALGEAISTLAFSRMGTSLGLVDRGNTRQASLSEHGIELFSLTLGTKPDWMTFMLDVPRSPMDESPWQKMMDCAAAAVGRFGGQLLDDNGLVLEAHQLATIGKQVIDRQQQLIDAGYAPGSPLALRLFN